MTRSREILGWQAQLVWSAENSEKWQIYRDAMRSTISARVEVYGERPYVGNLAIMISLILNQMETRAAAGQTLKPEVIIKLVAPK
jgi:hypothetical protein